VDYQWNTVARTSGDLQTIREGLAGADIDEVVVGTAMLDMRLEMRVYV
jgi:hypothetical protein